MTQGDKNANVWQKGKEMIFETRLNKLEEVQELYDNARRAHGNDEINFEKWHEQYKGDSTIDGSIYPASFIRNITYEIIESQVSVSQPAAKVDPESYSEGRVRNAKSIERMCNNLRNKLDFERMNDIAERECPICGAVIYHVEWDNSIVTHNTVGDVVISVVSAKDFIPEPNTVKIDDMEYCFIRQVTTRSAVARKFDIDISDLEDAEHPEQVTDFNDDTVELVVMYYKNDKGEICRFIWSGDKVIDDSENFYSRKVRKCRRCGAHEKLCRCDEPDLYTEDAEFEELERDVITYYGSTTARVIPAMTQLYVNGEPQYENVTSEVAGAELENGLPAYSEMRVPKMTKNKIRWYKPKTFPIVIRTNISKQDSWCGQSDCETIRPYQQEVNKIESRIHDKIIGSTVMPVMPEDSEIVYDNSLNQKVVRLKPGENKGMFGAIDTQTNISQDIADADRVYQMAKRVMGITDSFQGQNDTTAKSGRAKQVQVAQAEGRLASKRVMTATAIADLDRIVFEMNLAYADEPRPMTYVDEFGETQNDAFDRRAFIDFDERTGEWYYDDRYLFSVDYSATEEHREEMWQLIVQYYQAGIFGNPQDMTTVLRFWRSMEKMHHPLGRYNVEYYSRLVEQMSAQMPEGGNMQGNAEIQNNGESKGEMAI